MVHLTEQGLFLCSLAFHILFVLSFTELKTNNDVVMGVVAVWRSYFRTDEKRGPTWEPFTQQTSECDLHLAHVSPCVSVALAVTLT